MLSSWQLTYLFLGLFALPGLFVLAHGLREGLVGYRLHAVDPTPVADLANVSGPVEVSGTARTHDGTVEAPLTGTPCLAYDWAVEERRRDGDGDRTWTTIASGGSSIPFREFRLGPFDLVSGNARRYSESRLDPGEPVYVYGRSTYAPGTSREAGQVDARIGCGRPFVVADGTEAEATRRVLGRAAGFVAFGLLWLGFVAGIVLFG
jgi:hypothetical protein